MNNSLAMNIAGLPQSLPEYLFIGQPFNDCIAGNSLSQHTNFYILLSMEIISILFYKQRSGRTILYSILYTFTGSCEYLSNQHKDKCATSNS